MSLSLVVGGATMRLGINPGEITTWTAHASQMLPIVFQRNTVKTNLPLVESYDVVWRQSANDIICYLHDDVTCYEPGWDLRVLAEFSDPSVGIVGFGGGLRHGHPNLYKRPYKLTNLARYDYISNVRDAESHGRRITDAQDVAVLDGFALCVRRDLLDRAGGWAKNMAGIRFHCYDYAICALGRRYGYRTRVVGVDCQHHGGQTSTSEEYQEWLRKNKGMTDVEDHELAHRWFYDNYRDVMPFEVTNGKAAGSRG